MKTKTFTIIKTWYSAGVYGCSNEFFTCIYTFIEKVQGNDYNGWKDFERLNFNNFNFKGMYWAEERIREAMKSKGYFYTYTWGNFWKLPASEAKHSKGEYEAINYIKNNFKEDQE